MSPEPTADRAGFRPRCRRHPSPALRPGPWRWPLGLIAAGFSYFGTRDAWVIADRRPEVTPAAPSGEEADPAWDIELPEGPHRDEFQTSCLICHSARLPLGQPRFGRDRWAEIVHKMAAAYGRP